MISKKARINGRIDRKIDCVEIGDYSTLGDGCFIAVHCPVKGHSYDKLKVNIGHDVWIGYGSRITPGTTINSRTIIGMGSVVSGTLESDSIYAGNPVRRIKSRNPAETVKTRLYTRQHLTCIPSHIPKWDITRDELIEMFDTDKNIDFLLDKEFCYSILDSLVPDTLIDSLRYFQSLYKREWPNRDWKER